jgi:hypothetical protein
MCLDFKEKRMVPTHCPIRMHPDRPGGEHLKSWLIERSTEEENWREVGRKENSDKFDGYSFPRAFAFASGGECRFNGLVNVGRNHSGDDRLWISA